jgi:hypothetical protein
LRLLNTPYDRRTPVSRVSAPSFETIEQMARRLRVPVKVLFEFPERRTAK